MSDEASIQRLSTEERNELIALASKWLKARATKTREAFKERTLGHVESLRFQLFNEEFADVCGHQFKFTPNSLHHITACLNALEQAINKGELIRLNAPKASTGNIAFISP